MTGERIRVAIVVTRLNVGGPSFQVLLLARRLDPARFETLLIAGTPSASEGDMLQLRPDLAVPLRRIDPLRRDPSLLEDADALVRLTREIRGFRPHIVHTHLAKAGALGRIAARVAGVPVVVHSFHGHVLREYFDPVRDRVFRSAERALARISTRIVCISPSVRAEIEALGIAPREKLVTIPFGTDLDPFLHAPAGRLRAELGIDGGVPLVGIVARLVPIKAVDTFIDSAAIVAERHPDAVFVIVGDGELRPVLERRAAERGLARRIHFLGWRAELASVYADLDVVCLTSRNEGTPVAVIEALAAGRAVVASRVGGVPDLITPGVNGELVPPGDPRAVADAVLALVADADRRRRYGTAGRARVHPEHDAGTVVARMASLYADLVSRSHSIS